MSASGAAVLAHQGGWDEILLIIGPMIVVVLLLGLAKRRVDRNRVDQAPPPTGTTGPSDKPAH